MYLISGNWIEAPGWWSKTTYLEYDKRAKCVEDQYSKLVVNELPGNPTIDGKRTLGENIADLGGNRLAYYAYRKGLSNHSRNLYDSYFIKEMSCFT